MLPEQKDLIYKYFPELVQECNLALVAGILIEKGVLEENVLEQITLEDDKYHINRRFLFKILDYPKCNVFPALVTALKEVGSQHLANALDNRFEATNLSNSQHHLNISINVQFSNKFYDTEQYNNTKFYLTRGKNRGHVLIINNVNFLEGHGDRHGAEADENNLSELFTAMGLTVFLNRNLSAHDMYLKAQQFSRVITETKPDMGIIIIMSHGLISKNESMIVSSDNKLLPEDDFRAIFNNENCSLLRDKPKIFIYHTCRTILKVSANQLITATDADLAGSQRTYSDMLICHPCVNGYAAHRNYTMGSWYIQLLCKVFMNNAHNMDVESLFRKVDEELEIVSSLPWKLENENHNTQQTSTFQNIAFKKCFLHPGIYEEDGKLLNFEK